MCKILSARLDKTQDKLILVCRFPYGSSLEECLTEIAAGVAVETKGSVKKALIAEFWLDLDSTLNSLEDKYEN